MSGWGNNDVVANTPYFAAASVKLASTLTNATNLYGNTTPNVMISGATVGLFAVDNDENYTTHKGAHSGWCLRTEGSGGRAGRVQVETLVCLSNVIGDASDDATYPDTIIIFNTQPVSNSVISGAGNTATFFVYSTGTPNTAIPLTYNWQYNTGGAWANTSANTLFTGNTSNTLTVNAATTMANTMLVRVVVTSAASGVANTSANATITIR